MPAAIPLSSDSSLTPIAPDHRAPPEILHRPRVLPWPHPRGKGGECDRNPKATSRRQTQHQKGAGSSSIPASNPRESGQKSRPNPPAAAPLAEHRSPRVPVGAAPLVLAPVAALQHGERFPPGGRNAWVLIREVIAQPEKENLILGQRPLV